ncbi:MAG: hypothetical protein SYC29_09080 [Planctomycetota bacterium]|nr:hypothetical protein [Planctomycetota bacterium]
MRTETDKLNEAILRGPALFLLLLIALMLGFGGGYFAGRAHVSHEVRVVADEGRQALAAWLTDTLGVRVEPLTAEGDDFRLDEGEPIGDAGADELDEFFGAEGEEGPIEPPERIGE